LTINSLVMLKVSTVFILLALASGFSQNVNPRFDHLTIENGLSSNHTRFIYQDSKGFLWVATEDGLNRYDGYTFKHYKHDPKNKNSLSDNAVYSIYEDDENLFWITTRNGLNIFDPVKEKFTRFNHNPSDSSAISSDKLIEIVEDTLGNIWIASRQGLNQFNRKNRTFTVYKNIPESINSLSHNYVNTLLVDRNGNLWAGTKKGLNKFNYNDSTFTRYYSNPDLPGSLSNDFINCIYEDTDGNLWIGTISGLNKLVSSKGDSADFIHFNYDPLNPNSLSGNNVKTICEDDDKNLWIGTIGGGISIYNPQSNKFSAIKHNPKSSQSLSDDIIYHLTKDNSGIIWVSTFSKGINKFNPAKRRFAHYQPDPNTFLQIKENDITAVLIDINKKLWIGTNGNGLALIDKKSLHYNGENKNIYRKGDKNSINNDYITSIIQDREGFIWIGTFGGGLNKYDSYKKHFTVYKKEKNNPKSLSNDFIHTVYEDKEGFIWVGTGLGGVCRFDKNTNTFNCYNYNPSEPQNEKNPSAVEVTAICEDAKGFLWFGTSTGGLNKFDKKNQTFTHFRHHPDQPDGIGSNRIVTIYADSKNNLWVGTFGNGLNLYDRQSDSFIHFTEDDGLAGNTVVAIVEDSDNNLWISTNNGISKFDPAEKLFRNFNTNDGLQGKEFNANSVYYDENNNLIYFGGVNGLNIFNPDMITDNLVKPEIVITDFRLFNKSITPGANSVLDQSIQFTDQINLSYDQNVIAFEFSALHFINPVKNSYAYKMEGFDSEWINSGSKRFAEYTNLDPGNYVFKVKGANSDGIWNETGTSISIIIDPPFWRTWWAYVIYIVLIIGGFLSIRRYELNRIGLKNQLKLKELESKKHQEIDELKSKFFANISHEFRTPLTIILGSLDKLTKEMDVTSDIKEYAVMKRNASRLLQLINQLLELSRIESGTVKLIVSENDIVKFLKRITASFSSLAYQKNLKILFDGVDIETAKADQEIMIYFDKKKIETVFYNLLSNALKFTSEGERIEVNIYRQANFVKINFVNTGVEIPKEKTERIFERFYQVDDSGTRNFEGSGIGLSLAKEYVELHKGMIEVESADNKTRFTIYLPIGKSHLDIENISTKFDDTESFDFATSIPASELTTTEIQNIYLTDIDKTKILIVEDNYDLREMIKENLRGEYIVLEAENGFKGQEIAEDKIPDLIISDIMMPKMDGNELTKKIKSNEKTNHIPIILLTAKAATKDKLEGLESGADDYLIKPFNEQELKIRVRNLIKIRQQMREKFQSQMLIKPSDVIIPSTQKLFVDKLSKIIEANMSNEHFSVEDLCKELGMSRSQLHRKIKAVTNQSTSEFIRNFRLQRAAELLKQDAGNIAEISYMVGFNSQNYFTKMFQNLYGKTPLEFKRTYTK